LTPSLTGLDQPLGVWLFGTGITKARASGGTWHLITCEFSIGHTVSSKDEPLVDGAHHALAPCIMPVHHAQLSRYLYSRNTDFGAVYERRIYY
jgi:hypothetical protein